MTQSHSQNDTAPAPAPAPAPVPPGAPNGFAARPASQLWEQVSIAGSPQQFFWVWFKPANVPQGLIFRIPEETFQSVLQLGGHLTLRHLLHSVGVDAGWVAMWQIYGVAFDGMNGTTPLLDAAIPFPVMGADPNIVVYVNAAQVNVAQVVPTQQTPAAAADTECPDEVFERIEADWIASLEIENELKRLRKQLIDMGGRIKNLNRDLSPQERLHSSNEDKKEWLDARRWLRDGTMRLTQCIKEYDIGDTSAAGQRQWYEQTYKQYVAPRLSFDGWQQAERNFESYRKLVLQLQIRMNNAYSTAASNGERRAQQILKRIATKVREASIEKSFLYVIGN